MRPDIVRIEKIYNPNSAEVNWDDPELDFSHYSSSGVIGDPTHASAELGSRLWEAVIDEVTVIFKAVAQDENNRWLDK